MEEDEDLIIDELDTDWIENFNKIDEEFKNYYCEDLPFVKINSLYINSENEIDMVKEEKIILKTPSLLSKEELLQIIKQNCFISGQKYSLLGILKYNIDIEPKNLKHLFKYQTNKNESNQLFLTSLKNIDDIKFEKSITMFHDINQLFILFHQLICVPKSSTNTLNHNFTKKVFIYSNSNKKTKRKQYKDSITL